ncbi:MULTISPECIES: alpha/beta hydrolase [Gammaproteobacteria]|uniref:alpha/beta hydrolase n=1 Tax=Gammaproteobacteria TaxID=1236 RepID=UPI000DD0ABB4|nr:MULTISPECIES: dienelactone hydrolase family protein [Gammaproteobacteria]RTE86555.1 carboxylesterase [Aliidiomarina sp. B3213]TCZ90890.1 carboxylesterase [Lysobacter sp. N42]
MTEQYLPCVEVSPEHEANAAVIWLHGLGADGHDFEPIVPHIQLPAECQVRFVFPHAPKIPVTVNGGMTMPAWYDILEMSIDRSVDEKQLRISAKQAQDLIEREIERGIPADRIVLAGFSQGGAVAYEAGLSFDKKLAGIMALSTYLATRDSIQPSEVQAETPILVHHGSQDPIVPVSLGEQAKGWLTDHGYDVEFQTYPMAHQVCGPQIQDIAKWLARFL